MTYNKLTLSAIDYLISIAISYFKGENNFEQYTMIYTED